MKRDITEGVLTMLAIALYMGAALVAVLCPVVNVNAPEGLRAYTGLQISFGADSSYNSTDFAVSFLLQLPIYLMGASIVLFVLNINAHIKLLDFFGIGTGVAAGVLLFLTPFFCQPTAEAGFTVSDISLSYVGIIVACLPILAALLKFICVTVVRDD